MKAKGLSRNAIKYIAVIAMIADHTALFFFDTASPVRLICRFFGRITAPVMCYFLAEGFGFTSSKEKYALRLFVFAVISQPFYAYAFYNDIFKCELNMIATLFLSFCILYVLEKDMKTVYKAVFVLCLTAVSAVCDWGIICPVWVLIFYYVKTEKYRDILYCFTAFVYVAVGVIASLKSGGDIISDLWFSGIFIFPVLIRFYNGGGGNKTPFSKWIFYVIYPLHLIIIRIVFNVLNLN